MADEKSELDRMTAAAYALAAERIAGVLQAQGCSRPQALQGVEQHVTLRMGRELMVSAEADGGRLRSNGSSDDHITRFARELHLHHPEIGGTPVPLGFEPAPTPEGIAQDRALLAEARAKGAAGRERVQREVETLAKMRNEAEIARATAARPTPFNEF